MRKFDWILFISPIILTVIGVLSMYSTTVNIFRSQLMYLFIGILIVFLISRMDLKAFVNYSYVFFIFILLLTLSTLIFGVTKNGATAWFQIAGYTFQPSEILKISFILVLAQYFSSYTYNTAIRVLKSFIYFLLPIITILYLQRDIGTGIVFIVIWLAIISVIYFTKFEKKRMLMYFSILFIIAGTALYFLIQGYQVGRLEVYPDHLFLNMEHHSGIGYQVDQSLIAIGSSDFFGKGISHGTQNQFKFLPEKHNDFIFASIIEEMGLSAGLLILIMYLIITYRLYVITQKIRQLSVDIIIAGIIGLFSYHIIQNIGMNIGLMPVTGISLPFVSYGGSFILTCYIIIGMAESILLKYKKTFL